MEDIIEESTESVHEFTGLAETVRIVPKPNAGQMVGQILGQMIGQKKRKTGKGEGSTFKKQLWQDIRLEALRAVASEIREHSFLSTAYFIPMGLLVKLKIRTALYDILTAKPKSKKFQGKETKLPWPLWHEREQWLAIPRNFGCQIFGKPRKIYTTAGTAVSLGTNQPLLTAETCAQYNGIDQETAVNHIETYLKDMVATNGFGACIFCISPGYGKTCCAAHLISRLGRKALFVVPNESFMVQVAMEMKKFIGDGVRIGRISTSNTRKWDITDKDIVITTAKSIATISYDLSSFGTVIVDECHESITEMYSQMYYRFGAQYVIGLSATPERASDHCGAYSQWLLGEISWNEQRDISKLRWGGVNVCVYNIQYVQHPIKEIILSSGEPYVEGMIRQVIAHEARDKYILENILVDRHRKGHRIIVLGTRIAHMEYIHEQLSTKYNIPTGIIVGEHTDKRKTCDADRIEAQKQPILVASTIIASKALNIPELSCMVILDHCYTNDTFWRQCIGRITRDAEDKLQPELILLRDCYRSKLSADGYFASSVDNACKTLKTYSKEGFEFNTFEVDL